MQLTVNIDKTNFVFLLIAVFVVMGIGLAVATTPNPGHDVSELDFTGGFTVPNGDIVISSGNVLIKGNLTLENETGGQHRIEASTGWSEGNYCILRAGGSCPNGFEYGHIRIDAEDTNSDNKKDGIIGDMSVPKNNMEVYVCCKMN